MATIDVDVRKNRSGDRPDCSDKEIIIQAAADIAERIAQEASEVLSGIWNQPGRGRARRDRRKDAWRANPFVVRWFGEGDLTNKQIRNTRQRMDRIIREFDQDVRFDIIHYQTGSKSFLCREHAHSYCSPGASIKLCPSWFDSLDQNHQVRSIVHELSHKNGHIHHRRAITPSTAQQLALDHPKLARRNPSNFESFCLEYI